VIAVWGGGTILNISIKLNRIVWKEKITFMRIATWNVNSIKARLDHVKTWLAKNKPDVLMLQELKGEAFPALDFSSLGYHNAFVAQKAYNGVATLSLHPIETLLTKLPGADQDEQARYLETRIQGIRFINIYLPNGNPIESEKFTYKLAWMDRLRDRIAELRQAGDPFLLAGDFNVIPEDEDCYDPLAWTGDALFRPETRKKFKTLMNLGLYDAFRSLTTGPGHYTFWDYQAGSWPKNHGIRIDHILLSPALADRLESCTIDREPRGMEKASDHTPILANFSC
jgi:exodeoxyribonuclease-3